MTNINANESLILLSTVVAPAFTAGTIDITPVGTSDLPALLARVRRNLCGHPITDGVLRAMCPSLPAPERDFWDGRGVGLAVRPRGGVRGSTKESDTPVTLADLEAVTVRWQPFQWTVIEGERVVCDRCAQPITAGRVARQTFESDGSGRYYCKPIIHADEEHCRRLNTIYIKHQHSINRYFAAQRGVRFERESGPWYTPRTPEMRAVWDEVRYDVERDAHAAVLANVERGEELPTWPPESSGGAS